MYIHSTVVSESADTIRMGCWDRINPEMIYCRISKEMSSLYFGLHVFCLFEARAAEFDVVYTYTVAPVYIRVRSFLFNPGLEPPIDRINKPKVQLRHDLTIYHLWIITNVPFLYFLHDQSMTDIHIATEPAQGVTDILYPPKNRDSIWLKSSYG
jgi:hypothetical protein